MNLNDLSWLAHAAPYLLDGAGTTLGLTVVGAVIGMAGGTVLALLKLYAPAWLARLATWYVASFARFR